MRVWEFDGIVHTKYYQTCSISSGASQKKENSELLFATLRATFSFGPQAAVSD
jgi:hypothetical protein